MADLYHHGVKGQKWGRRKPKEAPHVKSGTKTITTKTKYGDELTMQGEPTPGIAKFLAKHSKGYRNRVNNSNFYSLKDKAGNVVGEMQTFKENKNELNIVWVGTNESARGKGYASAAMRGAVNSAKKQGLKKVTLEVPGNSPDARHIYEKMGFKAKNAISSTDDIWGGLTEMELNLNKKH